MKIPNLETHLKIAYIRKERKLSQTEIAEVLGISQNAYSRIERGETKLTVDRIKTIAKTLNISYHDLLSGAESYIDDNKNQQIDILKERIRLLPLECAKKIKELSKKNTEKRIEEKKMYSSIIKDKEKVILLLEEKIKNLENQLKNGSQNG